MTAAVRLMDRRYRIITLTPKGRAFYEKIKRRLKQRETKNGD